MGDSLNPSFGAASPFLLICRLHVKPEHKEALVKAAKTADDGVNQSEPGMLHHTFDVDPSDPCAFVWSEVYKDDAALLAHLPNPPFQAFMQQYGGWADAPPSVEVYGTLGPDTHEACKDLPFPVKYYTSLLGYTRLTK
jgi:quinol monooxygenase YgiN